MIQRPNNRNSKRILAALVLLACLPSALWAAERGKRGSSKRKPVPAAAPAPPAPKTVRIEASTSYERSRVHEFTFGGGYRELWKTPVELPLLDLQHEAGGLTPTKRFGGNQTPVLAFKGADGRTYTFRSTDKDPSALLHPDLQETFVRDIVQDQMAAQHPGAALTADRITEAAGVLSQHERLVVMPDDPALGEFRETFAGMVGTFFEFPQPASGDLPGFAGATEIIGHKEMFERLAKSPADRVDAWAFLRARLVDIMLGDFDRHRKQWRWARIPGNPYWQPLPEDRDMAFVRYEGVLLRVAHVYVPILQVYSDDYDDIHGLTFHGWEQDRWVLTGLAWSDWERIAKDVQSRVTDAVIDEAIAAQPPEYQRIDGERLRADLRGRRDRLVEGARKFYEHLAGEVAVQATDASETVTATRDAKGLTIEIAERNADGGAAAPYFVRRFEKGDTSEVRVYTRGGDDRVVIRGGRRPIRLKVVTDGQGTIEDPAGGARLYDDHQGFTLLEGSRTRVDRRPYTPPKSTAPAYLEASEIPPRDWGWDWYPIPILGYEPDVGAFLGAAALIKTYGFRKDPWSTRHLLTAGWATSAGQPRLSYNGAYRRASSALVGKLNVRYSGIEVLGFYGFGNDTDDDGTRRFFRARNSEFFVSPTIEAPVGLDELMLSVGPWVSAWDTKNGNRKIDQVDPYGSGEDFNSIGATARLRYDTRTTVQNIAKELELGIHDNPAAGYPTRGVYGEIQGMISPEVWDVRETYGSILGSVAGYVSVLENDRVTFAGRTGAEVAIGDYPYQNAAYLGGGGTFTGESTIRGYRQQRFAGDEMVFGNVDVRVFLKRVKLIFPGDVGVLAFSDVGRVFLDGENSDDWHWSAGGGLWFAPLVRTNAFSVTVAASPEEVLFYIRQGFHF